MALSIPSQTLLLRSMNERRKGKDFRPSALFLGEHGHDAMMPQRLVCLRTAAATTSCLMRGGGNTKLNLYVYMCSPLFAPP